MLEKFQKCLKQHLESNGKNTCFLCGFHIQKWSYICWRYWTLSMSDDKQNRWGWRLSEETCPQKTEESLSVKLLTSWKIQWDYSRHSEDNLNKCYNSHQIHVLPAEQWARESNQHLPWLSRKAKNRTRTQEIVISVEEPINYFHT